LIQAAGRREKSCLRCVPWHARAGVIAWQIRPRHAFLQQELAREKKVLRSIYKEVGHRYHEAVWMVSLGHQPVLDGAALARPAPARAAAAGQSTTSGYAEAANKWSRQASKEEQD